jgi:hypothetical protein
VKFGTLYDHIEVLVCIPHLCHVFFFLHMTAASMTRLCVLWCIQKIVFT